jgi:hypothetical protein
MLAIVEAGDESAGGPVTFSPPSGSTWTLASRIDSGAGHWAAIAAYWHVAAPSEVAAAAPYQWTMTPGFVGGVVISAFGNVDPTSPVEVPQGAYFSTANSSYSTASILTQDNNTVLVASFLGWTNLYVPSNWSTPSGLSLIANQYDSRARTLGLFYGPGGPAGPTPTFSSSPSQSDGYALTHILALRALK